MADKKETVKKPFYTRADKKLLATLGIGFLVAMPTAFFFGLYMKSDEGKDYEAERADKAEAEVVVVKDKRDKLIEEKTAYFKEEAIKLKARNDVLELIGCNCGCVTVNECKCNKNNCNNNNNNNNNNRNNNGNNNNRNNNNNVGGKVTVERKPVTDTLVVIHQFPEGKPVAETPRVRTSGQSVVTNTHYASSTTTEVSAAGAAFDKVIADRREYSQNVQFANNK